MAAYDVEPGLHLLSRRRKARRDPREFAGGRRRDPPPPPPSPAPPRRPPPSQHPHPPRIHNTATVRPKTPALPTHFATRLSQTWGGTSPRSYKGKKERSRFVPAPPPPTISPPASDPTARPQENTAATSSKSSPQARLRSCTPWPHSRQLGSYIVFFLGRAFAADVPARLSAPVVDNLRLAPYRRPPRRPKSFISRCSPAPSPGAGLDSLTLQIDVDGASATYAFAFSTLGIAEAFFSSNMLDLGAFAPPSPSLALPYPPPPPQPPPPLASSS